jgi:hypothetical protein
MESIVEEMRKMAAEDVYLRHGCNDAEYVEANMRDYQKASICAMCAQGKTSQKVSDEFTIETCSACGSHGVVVHLSAEEQRKDCGQILPLQQRILAWEQKVDRMGLGVSGSQLSAGARQSAENLWQCTAGNENGCRALEQTQKLLAR